jgi:hypothetical protein
LFVGIIALGAPLSAKAPAVTVGKIRVERPELKRELEAALRGELDKLDLSAAKEQFVLGAKLVELQSVAARGRVEATCVISAELVRKKGGSLRAMFRGRARAVDAAGTRQSAERAALQGAVRSAVRRLPEAIR